jgi:hypothetical protein
MAMNPRPKPSVKNQGGSASMAATEQSPITSGTPRDVAPGKSTNACKDIGGVGKGTRGETGASRNIKPRL